MEERFTVLLAKSLMHPLPVFEATLRFVVTPAQSLHAIHSPRLKVWGDQGRDLRLRKEEARLMTAGRAITFALNVLYLRAFLTSETPVRTGRMVLMGLLVQGV